jgi:hypothetical protein
MQIFFIALFGIFLQSCQQRSFSEIKDAPASGIEVPTTVFSCLGSEISATFFLADHTAIPAWQQVDVLNPVSSKMERLHWISPRDSVRYRMDLCADATGTSISLGQIVAVGVGETLHLKVSRDDSLATSQCQQSKYDLVCTIPRKGVVAEGLEELLFSSDASKLKLILPVNSAGQSLFHVVQSVAGSNSAVVASLTDAVAYLGKAAGPVLPPGFGGGGTRSLVAPQITLLGSLKQGDPFANPACELGWEYQKMKTWSFAQTKITVERCLREVRTSGKTVKTIELSFRVEENSKELSNGSGSFVFEGKPGSGMERFIKVQTHHNVADSFVFQLPNATYTLKQSLMGKEFGDNLVHFSIKPSNGGHEIVGVLSAQESLY